MTYKVTRDSCCVELYIFDIPDPKNLQNKKKIIALASLEQEIRKVTLMVTWPRRTRSRVIVGMWNYIVLRSLTLKTCKKKIIALASLEQEIRKVTLMVTLPWRTRSCVIVGMWNYIFLTSLTLKTCKTKKRSSLLRQNKRSSSSSSSYSFIVQNQHNTAVMINNTLKIWILKERTMYRRWQKQC